MIFIDISLLFLFIYYINSYMKGKINWVYPKTGGRKKGVPQIYLLFIYWPPLKEKY